MEGPFLLICLLLATLGHGYEGNQAKEDHLQSRYGVGDDATVNGTSPLLFQNLKAIVKDDLTAKPDTRRGSRDRVPPLNEVISSRLQSVAPPFALTTGDVKNVKCRRDSKKFLKHLNKMDLWALKMHDSSGKIPSGLLNGNINQFGDFDECVSINEPGLKIKGKYCLAYLQLRLTDSQMDSSEMYNIYKLLQSHFFFKSELTDPGHRVPRFSTMNWGLCIPNSCTSDDVEFHLRDIVERYSNGTGFDVEVRVDPDLCQESESFKVSTSFFVVSCLLLSVTIIAVVATLRDVFQPEPAPNSGVSASSLLHCFSLKRNLKSLLTFNRAPDDIQSIHGIRMMNALMLVLCHKSMALFFVPYSNRTTMVEKLSQPWSIIARIASLYTDSFIMISGLLASYSFVKTLNKNGKLDLRNEYLNRLIRIAPPLAAIILLCTFILPELGSGPQWNLTVSHHADKCKKNWWKNLLFIHNYFGFENMCLTHTHHMGIDTQLFFLSPFLVYWLFKWPMFGLSGLVGVAAISTLMRYDITIEKNLSIFIYPGITVRRMFDTANYSYIIPFHRLTSYIIGILLGYALRHYGKDCKIKSSHLRIGWTITFSFLSYVLTRAYEMNHPGYSYDNREAALYAALAPIAWCLFVGWIIFVSQIGCGGALGKFTSSKYFLIWTRLSYSVYLTQFPVFFFNVGLQKYPQQYSIFLLVNVLEYLSILIASVALTLIFDVPFVNLKKLLINR